MEPQYRNRPPTIHEKLRDGILDWNARCVMGGYDGSDPTKENKLKEVPELPVPKPRTPREKPAVSEADIQRSILDYMKLLGHYCWRNNVIASPLRDRFGNITGYRKSAAKGTADIICVLKKPVGRFAALECKTEKGRATPEQLKFIENVQERGGVAGIVRSIEDVDNLLKPPLT